MKVLKRPVRPAAPPRVGRTMSIITADAELAARLSRVAAAIDLSAEVTSQAPGVTARLVLVDAADVVALAANGSSVSAPVVVVAAGELTADQWRASLSLAVTGVHDLAEPDEVLVRLAADLAAMPAAAAGPDGRVLAIIGACGGAGASSMATALGREAQRRGEAATICDADQFGAGLEVTAGLERADGLCWRDIEVAGGRLGRGALDDALPLLPGGPGRLALLGFGESSREAIQPAVLNAALRSIRESGQLGVVDLPRTFDDAVLAAAAIADATVIISPAEVRGCFGAARAARQLAGIATRLELVVRGPSPTGLAATEIAEAVGIPLAAAMRPQPRLEFDVDSGRGPGRRRGPLTRAAGLLLDQFWGNR